MNVTRIVVLCVAAVAAGAAALLVRGMLGGGTPPVQATVPPPVMTIDVLVAAKDLSPGQSLDAGSVRWESWPKNSVPATFVTKDKQPDISRTVTGAFVRAPLVTGEPLTDSKIVRAGSASFMSATISPGKRAISISISVDTSAGGFILPNDRVDVILTRQLEVPGSTNKLAVSATILRDVRVLAIDQILHQEKDQQSAVGKTATLELAPKETELIARAAEAGKLSLSLRALGDSADAALDDETDFLGGKQDTGTGVNVIRYGIARNGAASPPNPERAPIERPPSAREK